MRCHICNEPAVGQCTACWRFYCADHGDGRCDNCVEQGREQMPGAFGRTETNRPSGSSLRHIGYTDRGPDDELAQQMRSMKASSLQKVLPIAQACQLAEVSVTLTSIELYEDGAILRYNTSGADLTPDFDRLEDLVGTLRQDPIQLSNITRWAIGGIELEVSDDRGTAYYAYAGGGGGDSTSWRGEFRITPAIPQDAMKLGLAIRRSSLFSDDKTECRFEVAI